MPPPADGFELMAFRALETKPERSHKSRGCALSQQDSAPQKTQSLSDSSLAASAAGKLMRERCTKKVAGAEYARGKIVNVM